MAMNRQSARGIERTARSLGREARAQGRDAPNLLRRVCRQCIRDDALGLAAELAYRFFLAIFPFFIFIAALGKPIAAWLGWPEPAEQVSELLGQVMPPDAAALFRTEIGRVI